MQKNAPARAHISIRNIESRTILFIIAWPTRSPLLDWLYDPHLYLSNRHVRRCRCSPWDCPRQVVLVCTDCFYHCDSCFCAFVQAFMELDNSATQEGEPAGVFCGTSCGRGPCFLHILLY